jgi:hypothetical protein
VKVGLVVLAPGATIVLVAASATAPAARDAQQESSCPTDGVGAVRNVLAPEVDVNGSAVYGRTKLNKRARVQTKNKGSRTGRTKFCVKLKQTECTVYRPTVLQLRPGPNVIARIDNGNVTCGTTKAGERKKVFFNIKKKKAKRIRLKMSDPIFSISTNSKTTLVKVYFGVVSVIAHGGTRVLGPNEKDIVPSGKQPMAPVPFVPVSGPEVDFANSLRDQVPRPTFGPPSVTGSPTLAKIFEDRSMRVSVDPTSQKWEARVFAFTGRYVGLIVKNWHIRVAHDTQAPISAAKNLCAGVIDLYVTPTAASLSVGAWTLPFLKDQSGVVWYLAGVGDERFRLAIRSFLIQTIQAGVYGSYFSAIFQGGAPSYGIFQPILSGPGKAGSPSCR